MQLKRQLNAGDGSVFKGFEQPEDLIKSFQVKRRDESHWQAAVKNDEKI